MSRRTPGLRREELAASAGVSIDYYIRLEQGRQKRPSPSVVAALAQALRLSRDETAHLHHLAGLPPPGRTARPHVRAQVRHLLTTLDPVPAFVLSRSMDVLAWNASMAHVVMDFALVPEPERNIVRLSFLEPSVRALWVDWHAMADDAVANIRAATARYADDPGLAGLVGELTIASPEFAQRWVRYDVRHKLSGRKDFNHPRVGRLIFDLEVLDLTRDEQQLVTYVAADAATSASLDSLLGQSTADNRVARGRLRVVS